MSLVRILYEFQSGLSCMIEQKSSIALRKINLYVTDMHQLIKIIIGTKKSRKEMSYRFEKQDKHRRK